MSKKEMRKAATKRLKECQKTLTRFVSSCENLEKGFGRFSEDCLKRMSELAKRGRGNHGDGGDESVCKVVKYFLAEWFRSFIAHKDEVMALWKGTIARDYLVSLHEGFAPQDRGSENSYYKNCKCLTMCSVDGIDYEYRMITEKYGSSSSLDDLIDANEDNSSRVTKVIDKLDANAASVRKAMVELKATKIEVRVTSKENKHMGEEMLFQIGDSQLIFTRGRTKWVSEKRADALSTVVGDPSDADVGVLSGAVNVGVAATKAKSRSAMIVIDKEDIRASRQLQRESELQRRQEEERRQQREQDTALNISLDEIKRAFGAQQLQSTFVQLDAEEWGMRMGVDPSYFPEEPGARARAGGAGIDGIQDQAEEAAFGGEWGNDSGGGSEKENGLGNKRAREGETVTEASAGTGLGAKPRRVANVNKPLDMVLPWLPRAESCLVLARVLVPAAYHARVGGQWLDVPVCLSWRADFPRVGPPVTTAEVGAAARKRMVAVSELLDEVYRRMWSRRAQGRMQPLPLLPRAVKPAGASSSTTEIPRGEYFALPTPSATAAATATTAPRTVFVLCHEHPSLLKVLARVADTAGAAAASGTGSSDAIAAEPGTHSQYVPSAELLARLGRWLEGPAAPVPNRNAVSEGEGEGESDGGVTLDLSGMGTVLLSHSALVLSALERVTSSASLAALHLPIAHTLLDHSAVPPALLALLLLLSRSVEYRGGGLSSDVAGECATSLRLVHQQEEPAHGDLGTPEDATTARRLWRQYCALYAGGSAGSEQAAAGTSELTRLSLAYSSQLFHSPSSSRSHRSGDTGNATTGSGTASLLRELLLPASSAGCLFPRLQALDLSYCVDRRASRARRQALGMVEALQGALLTRAPSGSGSGSGSGAEAEAKAEAEAGRGHNEGLGVAAAAHEDKEGGPVPVERLRLRLRGLLAAVKGSSGCPDANAGTGTGGEEEEAVSLVEGLAARWAGAAVDVDTGGVHAVI